MISIFEKKIFEEKADVLSEDLFSNLLSKEFKEWGENEKLLFNLIMMSETLDPNVIHSDKHDGEEDEDEFRKRLCINSQELSMRLLKAMWTGNNDILDVVNFTAIKIHSSTNLLMDNLFKEHGDDFDRFF